MTAVPQHMVALEHANEVRAVVAEAKREIRSLSPRHGAELAAEIIEHDWNDPHLGRARIDQLLVCVHRLGVHLAGRCLRMAGVQNPRKRLCELTPRQRAAVVNQLRLWAAGYRS